jgi:hypothetical protein
MVVLISYRSISNDCGIAGIDCRPFSNVSYAFYCPPACASQQIWNPHTIGDQEINYRHLVIGGGSGLVYRADSSICQAAIHAGVLEDARGGPIILELLGEFADFQAIDRNGIQSVNFDAAFPKSFTFAEVTKAIKAPFDIRWVMLAFSASMTVAIAILSLTVAQFFTPVFTILFMHVIFVSDRPEYQVFEALLSVAVQRFLPASFAAFVLYKFCAHPQLSQLQSAIDKTILWLGFAWFGALENYTLDHIPIRRLTPADLKAQPGAILWLALIIVLLLAIAIGQVHYLRKEGRLLQYLKVYALMAGGLITLALIPSIRLRLHHYIIALLLVPGTAMQTRPSLIYQGLLTGLFINGVARWGFASILQTDAVLRDLDGPYGSALPIVTATVSAVSTEFDWIPPPLPYDGLSLLVNDVERYRWYTDDTDSNYTWLDNGHGDSRTYFRFAYVLDGHALDYTKAAILERDHSWNTTLWK